MPHGPPNQLAPENSNIVWVVNVIDDSDPQETDGSPKWIDTATVAWEVRYPLPDGSGSTLIASGAGVSAGDGKYLLALSHTIAIAAESNYFLRVVITTLTGFVATIDWSFKAMIRTGETSFN